MLTPDVVAAFAALHIVDDNDLPIVPAPHHWLWLRLACDARIRKLLIIAPPEAAKTTWAVTAFGACYAAFNPEANIIIGSSSGPIAEARSIAMRLIAQSQQFRTTFPDVLPALGLPWEQTRWSLAPNGIPRPGRLHPTLASYGTGGGIIGSRADLIIADDLLDLTNSRTAHRRQIVEYWMHTSLLSRIKSSGRIIMIGTAWHHDDIYARARREGDWVVCHTPLWSFGGEQSVHAYLSYPDDWPHEIIGETVARAEVEHLHEQEVT